MSGRLGRGGRRVVVLATVGGFLLAGTGAGFAAPRDGTGGLAGPGRLAWQACTDTPGVECATLRVPVDWARPNGASVELALARRPATDPGQRVGSLVVNPGGPGGSGVDFVKQESGADTHFSAALRARFDIVGWDPRGVGASHPVRCDGDLLAHPVSLFPTDQAGYDALVAYNRALAASCLADTGALFDHIDTASTARDLEAIRAALGQGRLNFYGMSYGTLIGEQYAELFPHHLRAMALDSNVDHSAGAFEHLATLTTALEGSYDQFSQWCLRTPSCPLYPQDPRAVFDDLYARARAGTLYVPGQPDHAVAPEDLDDFIRGGLTGVNEWYPLAEEILAVLDEPATVRPATSRPPTGSLDAAPVTSPDAAEAAIICEDHAWNVSGLDQLRQLRRAMSTLAPHTHLSATGFKDITECLGWPRPVNNPQHPLRVHGSPPILMVNSRYDVATPYQGATEAARQIGPAALLLTYDGTSHVDYPETPCVQAAFDTYLIDLTLPAAGTHCAAVYPTSPPPAGRQPQRR